MIKRKKKFYTVFELASILNRTEGAVYSAIKSGKIKAVKIRMGFKKLTVIQAEEVDHIINSQGKKIE